MNFSNEIAFRNARGRLITRLLLGTTLGVGAVMASAAFQPALAQTAATTEEETQVNADGSVSLGTVEVKGDRVARTAGTNQIRVTQEELERKQPADISDVFSGIPEVAVGSSIPMSQKVYVNGIEETNLSVTIDGSRLNNKVFHHNGTNLIDPALLKAVTVEAGVAPADAGPGALGGSIAYETKDARDMLLPGRNFGGFVTTGYATNGQTFTTGVSTYGLIEGFEYLGYINYGDGNNYKAGNGDRILGTGTDLLGGVGKLAYQSLEGDRFEFSYESVRDSALRPFRANIGHIGGPLRPERSYDLRRQNVVFSYTDETPEGWWDPKVVLAYGVTDVNVGDFSMGETGSFNGKVENRFALDIGSITAGVDFYSDRARYEDPDYSTTERARNFGGYAQARLEPWDRTRLSFGFRGDNQRFEGVDGSTFNHSGLSGNVSGEYDLTDYLTAKAGYSHVWGGIPLAENFITNPNWIYGDGPDPVVSDNFTAGLVARFDPFTFEANIFRTNIDNARAPSYRGGPNISHDFVSKGVDISARYDWSSGYVRVSYAKVDADIDGNVADSFLGNYIGVPMGDIFNIQAAHTFDDWGLTVGGDIEIALKYSKPGEVVDPVDPRRAIPGYEVVNAFVEYVPPTKPNFKLRGEIKNIFDETYSSRATYGQEYVVVTPLYEQGRSFRISATARF